MAEYYVVRDKKTGLYFRGKGVNRWGKYYNQASIYRIRVNAENTIKEVSWRGEQAEVVPIQIFENTTYVAEVKHGYWEDMGERFANCSNCGTIFEALPTMFAFKSNNIFCRHCGAKMDSTPKERGGEQ